MRRKNPQDRKEDSDCTEHQIRNDKYIKKTDDNKHWSDRNVLLFCIVFRAINALLVQTYFVPDEHWQCLEVAHRIVFGYGHLTWEWKEGIRSYLHPMMFAILYKILAVLNLDTVSIMTKAPRLMQSVIAAFGDFYLYKLAFCIFGKHVAKWALFCQMMNWFLFFSITRTLSNSLETVLTTVAIFYWPLPGKAAHFPNCRKLALLLAALSCAIRPTSGIIWLYVGFLHLLETQDRIRFLFLEVIPVGAITLLTTCLLDRWLYGEWIIVSWNFLKFNFFSAGGDFYGTHPWHWYFTQGFPTIIFTFLPLSVAGIWLSKQWRLAGLIAWELVLYSLLGHKEFRFVMPVLPITLMFSGYCLASMDKHDFQPTELRAPKHKLLSCKHLSILALLISNMPVALYTSLVHQRGSEDVMLYLAKETKSHHLKSVIFLTQCHATPYYASLHHNLPMKFLDCTPSTGNQTMEGQMDESDHFMEDPVSFASHIFSKYLPSHVVLFDSEADQIREVMAMHGYMQVKRFFHAHFPVDRHLQGYILVYRQVG